MTTVPTTGETYAILMEHVKLAQEAAATMSHLENNYSYSKAQQWLAVSENLKRMQELLISLATKGLH